MDWTRGCGTAALAFFELSFSPPLVFFEILKFRYWVKNELRFTYNNMDRVNEFFVRKITELLGR